MKTTSCPVTIDFLIRKGIINSNTGTINIVLYFKSTFNKKTVWNCSFKFLPQSMFLFQNQIYRNCQNSFTSLCIRYTRNKRNNYLLFTMIHKILFLSIVALFQTRILSIFIDILYELLYWNYWTITTKYISGYYICKVFS